MCGNTIGRLTVEVLDRAGIAAGMVGGLGGHRVDQMLLDLARTQIRLGDAARDALTVPGAVVRGDIGRTDDPGCLDRHELRIAGPQPDAPERAPLHLCRHSRSVAIAFTAAAAIALPPR